MNTLGFTVFAIMFGLQLRNWSCCQAEKEAQGLKKWPAFFQLIIIKSLQQLTLTRGNAERDCMLTCCLRDEQVQSVHSGILSNQ